MKEGIDKEIMGGWASRNHYSGRRSSAISRFRPRTWRYVAVPVGFKPFLVNGCLSRLQRDFDEDARHARGDIRCRS